jgi:hypothetical protein
MDLQPPAQLFSTTLYDRHHPQQLSFVFIPARSLKNGFVPDLKAVKDLVDPNANFFYTIAPSYLPAALASLLAEPALPNPFSWVVPLPQIPGQIWIDPNNVGFAEYVAFSESLPVEESPLRSKSLMAVAVATGAKVGLIAGGATPFVLLTVPAGIILCTAGVVFGPALGEKVSKLIGA